MRQTIKDKTDRNNWVEAYRFVLIFLIALFHFSARYPEIYPEASFSFNFYEGGGIGNFMFMFISGFFLTQSLIGKNGYKNQIKFIINKWWRLFPTAALSVIIIYVVTYFYPLCSDRMVSFQQLLYNFLIIHPGIPYVDGSHWFISALLQIQIVLSFLFLINKTRHKIIIIILLFFISILLFGAGDIPNTKLDNFASDLLCVKWLPIICSGCLTKLIINKQLSVFYYVIPVITVLYYSYYFMVVLLIPLFCLFG